MAVITVKVACVWEYSLDPKYKFSQCGRCFNSQTGRELKQSYNSRCLGFNLNGRFKSLTAIHKQLRKVEVSECPF